MKNAKRPSFIKPEETISVIDNFINLKISELKDLSGPYESTFQDMRGIIRACSYDDLTEEETDNLTLLDIFCLMSKLKNDDPHAPTYAYELVDDTEGDGTDLYMYFCSVLLSILSCHRSNTPTQQSLPVRLFLEISVADLENYILTKSASDPGRNEEDISQIIRRIDSLAQSHNANIHCNAGKEVTDDYKAYRFSEVLFTLNREKNRPWCSYQEDDIVSFQHHILNTYSDIYTLLVEPFKSAFPSYFETH